MRRSLYLVGAILCGVLFVSKGIRLAFFERSRQQIVLAAAAMYGLVWCAQKLGQAKPNTSDQVRDRTQSNPPAQSAQQADEWQRAWDERVAALSSVLGPPADGVLHAAVPLGMGGGADVLMFEKFLPGIAYVTCDLLGSDQPPNTLGAYELMVISRLRNDALAGVLSRIAAYTLQTTLEPGHTVDVGNELGDRSLIHALLFHRAETKPRTFQVFGKPSGILLAIGITDDELELCAAGGAGELVRRLKGAGIYPYTDSERRSVLST